MIAIRMLQAVHRVLEEAFLGGVAPPDRVIEDRARAELTKALRAQMEVRGLVTETFIRDAVSKLNVKVQHGEASLKLPPDWHRTVDDAFHSGFCGRCGAFVPVPWNHERDDCDLYIVRTVMDA